MENPGQLYFNCYPVCVYSISIVYVLYAQSNVFICCCCCCSALLDSACVWASSTSNSKPNKLPFSFKFHNYWLWSWPFMLKSTETSNNHNCYRYCILNVQNMLFSDLITDFTVVLMNSFLCDKSNSGYLEYTCRHTVFIVISSKFALSKISLTIFLISSS